VALRGWLPDVIQGLDAWMSDTDIPPGAQWSAVVSEHLNAAKFGIICVTPDNINAPWILFEAGALSRTVRDSFVCPYLIGVDANALLASPLGQFQGTRASEQRTLRLVRSINSAKELPLTDDKLARAFVRWWPDLAPTLEGGPKKTDSVESIARQALELAYPKESLSNNSQDDSSDRVALDYVLSTLTRERLREMIDASVDVSPSVREAWHQQLGATSM
jgi:hypothetical protein